MDEFDARMKAKRAREIRELTEKTDIWNELWENATVIDTDPNSWLGKIKAEGDKLKDELQRYKNSFHLIKLAGGKEVELAKKLETIRPILTAITEGKGRFNTDPQIHCSNAVEDMKTLAIKALESLEGMGETPVDKLLEIIKDHLFHQETQSPSTDYIRGYMKGIRWTETEIKKVYEK